MEGYGSRGFPRFFQSDAQAHWRNRAGFNAEQALSIPLFYRFLKDGPARDGNREQGLTNTRKDRELDALKIASDAGFVYFIRAGRTPTVKIGWAIDPEKQLLALQTGCPHRLSLIGYLPGTQIDEQQWHDELDAVRLRGEWFSLTPQVRDCINTALSAAEAVQYLRLSVMAQSVLLPFEGSAA